MFSALYIVWLSDLYRKRPVPSSSRSEDYSQPFAHAIRQESSNSTAQMQYVPSSGFSQSTSRDYPSDYQQPSKRQRTSVSNGTGSNERDAAFNQRSYVQPQTPYGWNTTQNQQIPNNISEYTQSSIATSAAMPDFSFRYPIQEPASASSPYLSPRSQISNYGSQAQQMVYHQQGRYGPQTFPQGQFGDASSTSAPRIAQPGPSPRHSNPIDQLQTNAAIPYIGIPHADHRTSTESGNQLRLPVVKDEYFHYPQHIHSPEHMMRGPQSSQSRYPMANAQSSNHLPPLHSTVPSSQPLLVTSSTYNNYVPPDNRLPSQPIPQQNLHLTQERYTGYQPSSMDLEDRRDLHEPG